MLTLNDGRSELWQWDTNRKLTVDADCSQVHFSNKVFGRSIDVDVVDGVAIIPDILLQTDKELTAWAFVGTPENGYTKISKIFKVNKRNKPADYVFTPQDQSTLGEILDRIEDLENRPSGDVSEEDIQNAVNDYLDKNPVSFEEKDPTVPAWAKQPEKPTYTAAEVGALPVDTPIPDGIPIPSSAQVGQTIVVKAVDENGKPTEWEAADIPHRGEWEQIVSVSFSSDDELVKHVITQDMNGSEFAYDEILVANFNTALGGGALTVWFNTEEQYFAQGLKLVDFFVFGSNHVALFSHLVGDAYAGYSTDKHWSVFELSKHPDDYKIRIIALQRDTTTNYATIKVYGRNYE